jgi:hypothetical protein
MVRRKSSAIEAAARCAYPAFDMPFPQITFSNDNDMLITLPALGSVIFQRDLWDGHRVSYRIEKTYLTQFLTRSRPSSQACVATQDDAAKMT